MDILQSEQRLQRYVRYAIIRRVILKYVQRIIKGEYIEWITLNTNQGVYRKQLNPGQEPVADFCLCDGEQVEEVYAYCNLHGLWKC
ncbi:hypothetical protein I260019D6_26720 [Dorea longicatena]